DEIARLQALHDLDVLDSASEAEFDALVQAAAAVCGTPVALLTLVDAQRVWLKAQVGLPGADEVPRGAAPCAHTILHDTLLERGPAIFPSLRWRRLRKALPPPYDPRRLAEAVIACVGVEHAHTPLDRIDRPLLLTTVSWVRGELRLLRSRGLTPRLADSVTLLDAALATAAAPGHFPPHLLDGDPHLDGGLCANAPDALAVPEAVRHLAAPPETLHVLSIGTVGTHSGGMPRDIPRWGFRWPLPALMLSMSAQERLAIRQCEAQLGERYLRINQVPTPDQKPLGDLDVVDASMTGALIAYADAAVEDLLARRGAELDEFLR
ncbi:MAG: patatin-like phospholipase family protein, partial [Gammaproteobacteria bacterium]